MIKFFRRIRQKLLSANKFSKYLIYALGEIFLVVIGILIALQINNWNEYRKERILEDSLLEKMSDNIKDDIDQYEKVLTVEANYRIQIDSFLTVIRNPTKYRIGDLDKYYKALWFFERFTPNKGALTNLISSGKINIIQNEVLLENILEYYKTIDEHTAGVDAALASYSRNQIGPYFMKFDFMDSNAVKSNDRKRKSLLEYHQDPAVENLISARIQLMNTQKDYYEEQIRYANNLLMKIKEELK